MKRKDYIDWLRNLAILFLFPFHTARIFNDNPEFYVKGPVNTLSSALVNISSFWFMPLLFLLAGMSSYYALRKRSARSYAKERYLRLFIPFLFGCLVIVPPQAYYAMRFHNGYGGSYADFLGPYFTDFSHWTVLTGISPAHLWFILFLFLISIAALPLMLTVVRNRYTPTWLDKPVLALAPAAGLALLSFLPEIGGENIFVYAGYVLLGFLIATDDSIIEALEGNRRVFLCVAVPGAIGILIERFTIGSQANPLSAAWHYPVCWATLLAVLGYGKRYLDRRSAFMDYFSRAAFPVYILHQTYLIVIAYYVLQTDVHGAVAFPAIMVPGCCLSIATYEIVRRTPGLRIMFGLRAPRRPSRPLSTGPREQHGAHPPRPGTTTRPRP
ncbi:acyltransferase family protein [Streptomyces reniochalinae]|uniref:acyltransferase family protein n=1 Tax=Streptomyces reniochalinae TaxID=2250578 RepID=UPI0015F0623A|nr:acyltransferase [Streptomyces reniochalinae]